MKTKKNTFCSFDFVFGKIKDVQNLVVTISNEWNDKMSIQTMVKVYPIEREEKIKRKTMVLAIKQSYETLKKQKNKFKKHDDT